MMMTRSLIVFCLSLLLLPACNTKVDKLAARCSAGDQEACRELACLTMDSFDQEGSNACRLAVEKLTGLSVLAGMALENNNLSSRAFDRLSELYKDGKLSPADKDGRVRLIAKLLEAIKPDPSEKARNQIELYFSGRKSRVVSAALPAFHLLTVPALASYFGEVESIRVDWRKTQQTYYNHADGTTGDKWGEIISCRIKVANFPEPLARTWESKFDEKEYSLELIPADVLPEDLEMEILKRINDQKLFFDLAASGGGWLVTAAAVERLTDYGMLNDLVNNQKNKSVIRAARSRLEELNLKGEEE